VGGNVTQRDIMSRRSASKTCDRAPVKAHYAQDISPDEAELGFEIVQHDGESVVRRSLGRGLHAVKVLDGARVVYAICDDKLLVLYAPALSLDELKQRFSL
jgi:hypothetical protein